MLYLCGSKIFIEKILSKQFMTYKTFFIFQIASSSSSQSNKNGKVQTLTSEKLLINTGKVILAFIAVVIGTYAGFWIGLIVKPGGGELDFGGGPFGALIGAAAGLLLCWYIFTKRKQT